MKNGLQKITALFMAVLMLLTCFCAGALGDEQYSDSVTPGIGLYSILDPEKTSAATYVFLVGGTEYARQTVKDGEILYEPTAPTAPENAVFRGWYTDSDELFTGFGAQTVTQTQTIRLTARFEVAYYVYFYTPDGTTLKHTEVVTDPEGPYDFSGVTYEAGSTKKVTGWSAAQGGTTDISHAVSLNGQSSISLYAIETDGYWVIFHTGEGSVVAPQFKTSGETLELAQIDAPSRAGYTFGGWYDNEECTGGAVTSVNAAAVLNARWVPTTVNYMVIHWWENADDSDFSFHESEMKTGLTEAQTAAAAKTYPGFTTQKIEQQTIQGDGSTIVNVYYTRKEYTVNFWDRNGQREYTQYRIKAKYGANIEDKWPGGVWYVRQGGNTAQGRLEIMPFGGTQFYGQVEGQGGLAYYYVEVLPGESGTRYNGRTYKLDHTDYGMYGWSVTDEDRYEIKGFTFREGTRNGRPIVGAEFYYTRNSYNIVFINNGVQEEVAVYRYEQRIDDAYYTPASLADKKDYIFAGWYDNELCEGDPYEFEGKTMPANNIILYAKWAAPTYTVSFDLGYEGAAGAPDDQTVAYKQKAVQPETPVREGFTFTGWYDEDGKLFSFETPIVKDTKLTARWLSNSVFTVKYDVKDDDIEAPKDETKYAEGAKAAVADITLPSSVNKVFLGWAKSKNASKADYQPGDAMEIRAADANEENVIYLYAVWGEQPQTTKLVYNLNYIAEGESEAQTFYHEENGSADLPNNATVSLYGPGQSEKLTRPGYTLLGWAKNAEAQTPDYSCGQEIMLDQNNDDQENMLYAVWKRSTADVTITKTVTGNFGDKQKAFEFTVSSTEAVGGGEGYTLSQDAKEISFSLSHEQSVTIRNVPIGVSLALSEEAPGYSVSVKMNGEASGSTIVVREGVNAIEVVNFRDVVPDTGVGVDSLPYILILAAVLGLGALMLVLRRRSRG